MLKALALPVASTAAVGFAIWAEISTLQGPEFVAYETFLYRRPWL